MKDVLRIVFKTLADALSVKRRLLGVAFIIISGLIFFCGFWVDFAMISLLSLYGLSLIFSLS